MKTLLAVLVAGLFAATSLNVAAQAKDVTTKSGGEVKAKDGTPVGRKEVKDKPKGGELPKIEKRAKKEKLPATPVKTKSGGPVTTKDGKDVGSKK